MGISEKHQRWLEQAREIDSETAAKFGLFTGRRVQVGDDEFDVVPDESGDILVFPFIDGGIEVNYKYRAPGKKFWQKKGGKKTFWNADILDDPSLHNGTNALVICEGEPDALSVIKAGYPFAVSVPDGAPPARGKDGKLIVVPKTTDGIDPEHDDKYSFIFNNWDRLKKIKRIIIATDADEPGQRLAEELVRRLDRVRCFWVSYPEGCKDFNEVLVQHDSATIMRIIAGAREYPVSGLYRLSEIPSEPPIYPVSTGWARLDQYCKVFTPALMVVTGFAGNGKSTWTEQLVANLAHRYDWTIAIASFEMRIRPYITDTLSAIHIDHKKRWVETGMGDREEVWNSLDHERAEKWLEEKFIFIGQDPENEDDDLTIEWLIDKAEAAVIRHGARVLLIDPWNEIDHSRVKGETGSDYVGRAIRMLKRFAKRYGVLVIIVAHPTKGAVGKPADAVSLYDISDSAHFANKADIGVVVARAGTADLDTLTTIIVKKIRYQPDTGRPGKIDIEFDPVQRIFAQ